MQSTNERSKFLINLKEKMYFKTLNDFNYQLLRFFACCYGIKAHSNRSYGFFRQSIRKAQTFDARYDTFLKEEQYNKYDLFYITQTINTLIQNNSEFKKYSGKQIQLI